MSTSDTRTPAGSWPIVVFGAGGMGREALAWAGDCWPDAEVAGFLDDGLEVGARVATTAVLGGIGWLDTRRARVVVAIGDPVTRRRVGEAVVASGSALVGPVHPTAWVGPGVVVGRGAIIGPNVTLTRDVTIGELAIVNFGAQLGHDVELGDDVFVGPGANLAGAVVVERGAELGMGCNVLPGRRIGAEARIGAGAVVVADVPAGATAVGVPARLLDGAS